MQASSKPRPGATIVKLPIEESDTSLVDGLLAGRSDAAGKIFLRHAPSVRRVLVRVLGLDQEIPDLLQEVFVVALERIATLDEPAKLEPWLVGIAVHRARGLIRKRRVRRLLRLAEPEELERLGPVSNASDMEAERAVYRILDSMPTDQRLVFALRHIAGMELTEVASACNISRATVSRRLAAAQQRFLARAARSPALLGWSKGGEQ